MEFPRDRIELERMLTAVWEAEDRNRRKSSLAKWLFALALLGMVLAAFGVSEVYTAVMTALTAPQEKLSVDPIAVANVAEDIDYRIAQHAKSSAGWHAFLEAHPDGPHAQAAHAELERLLPTPPPQPVEVAEQSPPSPSPTPAVAEKVPSPPSPVKVVESQPTPAPEPVMVMREPAPPSIPAFAPVEVAKSQPLPLSKPREIAVAKPIEPAHHGSAEHRAHHEHVYGVRRLQEYATQSGRYRTEYRAPASRTNVFAVLGTQLSHPHRQRLDINRHGRWT